jgi:oligopeptide transport system ATP-binding protein
MSRKTPLNLQDSNKLVEVQEVSKFFKVSEGTLKAVNNVNIDIYKGETLGLVGESGCGKSTFGKVLMGIYPPTHGKSYTTARRISKSKRVHFLIIPRWHRLFFRTRIPLLIPV